MPAGTKKNQVPSLKRKSLDDLNESAKLCKDSEQSLTEIRDAQAIIPHSPPHQNSIEIEMVQNSPKVKQITEKMIEEEIIEEEIIPRNKDRPYTKVIQEMNKKKWQNATDLHRQVLKVC
uniref:Uncharacterized protein n=1 Tax=Panagrolaimus davidi TaxID=227884 RepID=A0A914QZ18_9BILA